MADCMLTAYMQNEKRGQSMKHYRGFKNAFPSETKIVLRITSTLKSPIYFEGSSWPISQTEGCCAQDIQPDINRLYHVGSIRVLTRVSSPCSFPPPPQLPKVFVFSPLQSATSCLRKREEWWVGLKEKKYTLWTVGLSPTSKKLRLYWNVT